MAVLEKKFSVFVSSTYVDLVNERIAVSQALLELGCFPAGMELFPASNDEQWSLIQKAIDESDYYVVVVAGRYGSTTPDGTSYTEREYDYALKIGIPILTFVHREPGKISKDRCEHTEEGQQKLDAFRTKVMSGKTIRLWVNPEELKGHVLSSLISAFKTHPRTGWIRADQAADLDVLREVNELRKENEELKKQSAVSRAGPPLGSDVYAGGGDTYKISSGVQIDMTAFREDWSIDLSWDRIFYYVGPQLAEGRTRDQALGGINMLYALSDKAKNNQTPYSHFVYANVGDQILYQFSALGLAVKMADGKWKLTSYGEQRLVDLYAIRRKPQSDRPAAEKRKR